MNRIKNQTLTIFPQRPFMDVGFTAEDKITPWLKSEPSQILA